MSAGSIRKKQSIRSRTSKNLNIFSRIQGLYKILFLSDTVFYDLRGTEQNKFCIGPESSSQKV